MEKLSKLNITSDLAMQVLGILMKEYKFQITDVIFQTYIPIFQKLVSKEYVHENDYVSTFCFYWDWFDHLRLDVFNNTVEHALEKGKKQMLIL